MRTVTRPGKMARRAVARAALTPMLRQEWQAGVAVPTERLAVYAWTLSRIQERAPRTLLDVGPGPSPWPYLVALGGIRVTAVDNLSMHGRGPGWWRRTRHFNRHYYVLPRDIAQCRPVGAFDFMTCMGVLEAVVDDRAVVRGMFANLAPGGAIAISTPYNDAEFVSNAYALPDAGYGADIPYPCRQYSRAEVERWLDDNDARIADEQFLRSFTGPYWTMGERLSPPVKVRRDEPHHLACLLLERT